jgi:aminopeptidase N
MDKPAALAQQQIASPLLYRPQPFDVLRYSVFMDLSKAPSAAVNRAHCRISFRWTDDPAGKKFCYHLRGPVIDSVKYNGKMVEIIQVGTPAQDTFHYAVYAPADARKNDTVQLDIWYKGMMGREAANPNSWGGVFSTSRILYAIGVGFYANYVGTTQHWLPCYDHPSDKAAFTAQFRVPKGMMAVSNGVLQKSDTLADAIDFFWNSDLPAATYLLTFAVDSLKTYTFGNPNNVVYSIRQDSAVLQSSFRLLPRMVTTLEKLYGPYPFEKVGYVLTPTGSMEHQTMISLAQSVGRNRDTVNSTALHELAHQWFGDLVTPQDYRYAWLTESFATFSESMWAEELRGKPGFIADQAAKLSSYLGSTASSEGILPLDDFSRVAPSSNYPGTIYVKGAVVLGMLRYQLGDSILFGALRKYLDKYRFGNATTSMLQKVLEEFSGKNLEQFFRQWIIGKGWPRLRIDTGKGRDSNGKLMLKITQIQPQEYGIYRDFPLEIGFRKNDNSFEYRVITVDGPDALIVLDSVPAFRSMNVNQGPTLRTLVQIAGITDVLENEQAAQPGISVYPNPAADFISIEYPAPMQPATASIMVSDMQGRVIRQWTENTSTPIRMGQYALLNIDIQGLPSGNYAVRMNIGNGQENQTFSSTFVLKR